MTRQYDLHADLEADGIAELYHVCPSAALIAAIATAMNVSRSYVRNRLDAHGIDRRPNGWRPRRDDFRQQTDASPLIPAA